MVDTPPKINIEPENDGLEDDLPFPGVYSQVPAVNLPGCIPLCTGFHTCFWCFAGFLNHQLPSLSGCDLAISS